MLATPVKNRLRGKAFEEQFLLEAKYQGLYARKNHIAAKVGWKGKLIPVKGDLDFRLIDPQSGRVGFFECKAFVTPYFYLSDLEDHQLDQAVLLNECNVPAGFVVLFGTGQVCFFTGARINGTEIHEDKPKKRFAPEDGVSLGTLYSFNLRPLIAISSALNMVGKRIDKRRKKTDGGEIEIGHA